MRTGANIGNAARERAFTLVELMTVIVIIAILTALIVPEMKGTFQDALLRSTGRELVDAIELSSSRAISMNQTVRLDLDEATGRYELARKTHHNGVEEFEPLKDVAGASGKWDTRVSVRIVPQEEATPGASDTEAAATNQMSSLTFNPDGTADNALIMLKDHSGFQLALRLNPITSRVSIIEPPRE
jgi:type II secretion system protein H